MKKKKPKFSNTHEYYNYLRNTDDKDLNKGERKDKAKLYKTLDSLFLKANSAYKNPVLTVDGRKRLSTMIKPELKMRVQTYGNKEGYSVADVIELALLEYLEERNH